MYQTLFSSRAQRAFQDLPQRDAEYVRDAILKLQENPRAHGTIKLAQAPVAQYRYRVGNYRLLFDLDDDNQVIELVDVRKRDERTYR
ncbi:MAG: Plasmid stabilization system protein [Chloroflexi bacterium]|nr:Plasmid stabilization system protein [Chloroflexota bacterium]